MGVVLALLGELKRTHGVYREVVSRITVSPGIPQQNTTKSFWMEPQAKIAQHCSALPETVDIVIIGSGISGLSVARRLLTNDIVCNKELRILMLEARETCSGATGRCSDKFTHLGARMENASL